MNNQTDVWKLRGRKCPVCGKEFCASLEWVYRRSTTKKNKTVTYFYCSWRCLQADRRELEAAKEAKRKAKEERMDAEGWDEARHHKRKYGALADQIKEMLEAGRTDQEIMDALHLDSHRPVQIYKGMLTRERNARKREKELRRLISESA